MIICVRPVETCKTVAGPIALPRMVMSGQLGLPHSPATYEPSPCRMMARTQTGCGTPGCVALIFRLAVSACALWAAAKARQATARRFFAIAIRMGPEAEPNYRPDAETRVGVPPT